jgi:hypothetical protein
MASSTKNSGKPWSREDVMCLSRLASNTPARVIGIKLGRSEDAVRAKAQSESISLGAPNRSPYGPRK